MLRQLLLCLAGSIALTAQAVEMEPAELEPFVDGIIEAVMENEDVAGAVLGVVQRDDVILLEGYGESDVETGTPVDPMTTLFRPGSVSKIFTWVALMQLRDAGKLDLQTDINEYLEGVKVPATFDEPITIEHLMTHTPGFEDLPLGLFGRDAASMKPLEALLGEQMPARVRPPGELASYSNHGVALAGLIVEQVSGLPWAEYIERHILEPLEMEYTTMRQPLPEALAPHMSKGYAYEQGRFVEKGFEFVPAAPAGGASASAGDMVKLIRAFLGDGGPILSESTNAEMQTILHRANENAGGLLHGFYEFSSHGEFIIGHGGDTLWFHSELVLLPGQDIGWFISTNAANGPAVRSSLRREVLDRYFARSASQPIDMSAEDLAQFAGAYGALRHSHSDFTKLSKFLGALTVAPSPDTNELLLVGGGQVRRVEPIGPATFKNPRSETVVSFDMDADGVPTHMHLSSTPVVAFERMTGLASPTLHWTLLSIAGAVFAWVLIAWPVQRYYRRFLLPRTVERFRLAAWWMPASIVVFILAALFGIDEFNDVIFGVTPALQFAITIPWVTLALALVTLALTPAVLRETAIGWTTKIGYAFVVLSGLALSWFFYYWQIL